MPSIDRRENYGPESRWDFSEGGNPGLQTPKPCLKQSNFVSVREAPVTIWTHLPIRVGIPLQRLCQVVLQP